MLKKNKYIISKKNTCIFKKKSKKSIYMSIYNNIDTKPLQNFIYTKECLKLKSFFFKNIHFWNKTKAHMWWIIEKFKNTNICFVPNFFSMSKMQVVLNFNFKKILYESSYGNYLVFYNSSFIKNKNIFMLPSKKRFSLPFIIFSFFNRKENFFKRKNFYGFYKYV